MNDFLLQNSLWLFTTLHCTLTRLRCIIYMVTFRLFETSVPLCFLPRQILPNYFSLLQVKDREAGCRQTQRGCCCFVLLWGSALFLPLLVTYGWDSTRDPSWAGDTAAGAWHLASCKRGLWERRVGEGRVEGCGTGETRGERDVL